MLIEFNKCRGNGLLVAQAHQLTRSPAEKKALEIPKLVATLQLSGSAKIFGTHFFPELDRWASKNTTQ